MSDAHVQVYGWINGGGNISTNSVRPGGNAPAAYDYTPNAFQLDQAVVYIERLADTVQLDHFDWGFRLSALYGENYRYTTAYGLFSYQLLNHNLVYGFDFPMVYADLYFPVFQGMDVRLGRFISIPDIEAQLAPNNYTYVHSLTYTFDNYTNTGIQIDDGVDQELDHSDWRDRRQRHHAVEHRSKHDQPPAGQCALSRCDLPQGSWRGSVSHLGLSAGPAMTDGTTSTSSPTPSMPDNGATITCNGSAPPIITSSTTTGTWLLRPTICTRIMCRMPIIPLPQRSSPAAARRSARRSFRSMPRVSRSATTRQC